jgi:hypothetical protein
MLSSRPGLFREIELKPIPKWEEARAAEGFQVVASDTV